MNGNGQIPRGMYQLQSHNVFYDIKANYPNVFWGKYENQIILIEADWRNAADFVPVLRPHGECQYRCTVPSKGALPSCNL